MKVRCRTACRTSADQRSRILGSSPYFYTKLAGVNGHGGARKDHKLNPINSDYDLFSAGKNGVFKPQVSQKDSLDDIIRARDGGFIGLAEEF